MSDRGHVMSILDSREDAEAGGYYVVMPRADVALEGALHVRRGYSEYQAIDGKIVEALVVGHVLEGQHRD